MKIFKRNEFSSILQIAVLSSSNRVNKLREFHLIMYFFFFQESVGDNSFWLPKLGEKFLFLTTLSYWSYCGILQLSAHFSHDFAQIEICFPIILYLFSLSGEYWKTITSVEMKISTFDYILKMSCVLDYCDRFSF